MNRNNTICALATPTGQSAIATIRLSGSLCKGLIAEIFNKEPKPRYACFAPYKNLNGEILDEVIYTYFQAPHSYTGEDSLEISTHGNPFIIQNIIEDLFARGCSPAENGEYTKRAFLNKKMDLSQAEAVSLMISARSAASLKASQRQLAGELGKRINSYTSNLVDICALVEAYIDFPEDELPEENLNDMLGKMSELIEKLSLMIENSKYSNIIHEGIKLVILGAPNAGKSSILNLLLGSERAIVSDIAGTTRDFISDKINVGKYLFNISDTAGIRNSSDKIEALGIEKALEIAKNADLILLVIDSSESFENFSEDLAKSISKENTLIIFNKADLSQNEATLNVYKDFERLSISSKEGKFSSILKDKICAFIEAKQITPDSDDILVSARHTNSLISAKVAIENAMQMLRDQDASELIASEVRGALDDLGEIVGKVDCEDILGKIFSQFCIGK
ncbi:MAG: tRNA uridine-5-carboxymethylaminomethyl(34) synthesis GTPase MnmE [Opitutales bacterium]